MELDSHLEENHAGSSAKYIKNFIFGGLDGIITTFSIIAASIGANLSHKNIIILSIANLLADAISMGLGEYISSRFEDNYVNSEYQKELNEFDNNFDYEKSEMIELYQKEGITLEDSNKIVDILTSNPEYKSIFLKYMVKMELGLDLPDPEFNIKKAGLTTGLSFVGFGFVPIIFFLIFYWTDYQNDTNIFIVLTIVSFIALFILGLLQSHITKQNKLKNSIVFVLFGFSAFITAFLVGYGLESLI